MACCRFSNAAVTAAVSASIVAWSATRSIAVGTCVVLDTPLLRAAIDDVLDPFDVLLPEGEVEPPLRV